MDIATVAVIALPSAIAGAFLAYTLLPRKDEGSPNACGDALTIAELTEDRANWQKAADVLGKLVINTERKLRTLEAENRDLHTDIAEKAKRLSDAGLQSAGGVDAA